MTQHKIKDLLSKSRYTWRGLKWWGSEHMKRAHNYAMSAGETVEPKYRHMYYKPLLLTPLHKVKVVFVNNRPHIRENNNDGLAFSCPTMFTFDKCPRNTRVLVKECCDNMHYPLPRTGNLEHWARQGVLLLNATVTTNWDQTICKHNQDQVWDRYIYEVIGTVRENTERTVFVLFGNSLTNLGTYADLNKGAGHTVLRYAAPFGNRSVGLPKVPGSKLFTHINDLLGKDKALSWRFTY